MIPTDEAACDRLRRSRVLIVGVGGLGAPAAMHLAAAGIGTLGLMDFDAVELSNLHRQVIYRTADCGQPKAIIAAERLRRSYSHVSVRCFEERLSADNLPVIFGQFEFVIDGTDRIASKYLVNDGAVLCGVPFAHAGISGFQGQIMTVLPGRSACLRCLFPLPPLEGEVPSCQEAGVIGALAGTLGLLQALEALKYVLGIGALLADRILIHDGVASRWRTVMLSRNPRCPLCGERPAIRRIGVIDGASEDAV